LGILALLTCGIPMTFGSLGILCGLIAVILGILGKRQLQEEGRSSGMAIGGLVLGVIGLLGGVTNAALCIGCLSMAEPVTQADDQAGQEWAEQQAQQLQEMLAEENQPAPGTPPPVPAVPPVPGTPPVPPSPGMPATPPIPTLGGGGTVAVNVPVSAMFSPGLPEEPSSGRPYMDYTLAITAPGTYTITLVSPNSTAYDPYLVLLQNGAELDRNDDGAGYPNSRISRMLTPGAYVVRVTSFRRQQVPAPAAFTLTVTGG